MIDMAIICKMIPGRQTAAAMGLKTFPIKNLELELLLSLLTDLVTVSRLMARYSFW